MSSKKGGCKNENISGTKTTAGPKFNQQNENSLSSHLSSERCKFQNNNSKNNNNNKNKTLFESKKRHNTKWVSFDFTRILEDQVKNKQDTNAWFTSNMPVPEIDTDISIEKFQNTKNLIRKEPKNTEDTSDICKNNNNINKAIQESPKRRKTKWVSFTKFLEGKINSEQNTSAVSITTKSSGYPIAKHPKIMQNKLFSKKNEIKVNESAEDKENILQNNKEQIKNSETLQIKNRFQNKENISQGLENKYTKLDKLKLNETSKDKSNTSKNKGPENNTKKVIETKKRRKIRWMPLDLSKIEDLNENFTQGESATVGTQTDFVYEEEEGYYEISSNKSNENIVSAKEIDGSENNLDKSLEGNVKLKNTQESCVDYEKRMKKVETQQNTLRMENEVVNETEEGNSEISANKSNENIEATREMNGSEIGATVRAAAVVIVFVDPANNVKHKNIEESSVDCEQLIKYVETPQATLKMAKEVVNEDEGDYYEISSKKSNENIDSTKEADVSEINLDESFDCWVDYEKKMENVVTLQERDVFDIGLSENNETSVIVIVITLPLK